jgi:hypothetical protein
MDWCSVYLTPEGLPKYIYLSPPLICPTTYNGIRTKNRLVWITPGAAPIHWMGPIRNPRWEQKRTEGYVIVSMWTGAGRFGHSRFGHTTSSAIDLKSIRPWNIYFFKHFMINDQYKLDIVDRLVNCKTIKCNYVHYFMIISNYLFFDLTISCILWLLSVHEMASYELCLSKLTTSWSQVLVDRTLYDASDCPSPFFSTSIFFHVHNILQLSMYHCMTYIK